MRYISASLQKDLARKVVLLSGPRQAGKTTLAKSLVSSPEYLNFDVPAERLMIKSQSWDRSANLLILDELHKLKNWKLFLKGLTDSAAHKLPTIVTGSARLDVARKVGDSLAGRYFLYHLHPIDIKEAVQLFKIKPEEAFNRIMTVSGFPEPFLLNDVGEYRRWRSTHSDIILRQDLFDTESVEKISQLETLLELLKSRVGAPIAYANLARELDCAPRTVKRWLQILENLFVVFKLQPYSHKLSRAILKAPKYYFFDCASVVGDEGARFENLVALALKKEIDFRRDCFGDDLSLYFVRNKDGDEIDFLILKEKKPFLAVEAKWSDDAPHKAFKVFSKELPYKRAIQLVAKLEREKTYPFGLEIRRATSWLSEFVLT
jgi:predicted AAA+ superfamily ATPase